ncbi:MAG: D-alanine--D-alanine ligase [Clostridium sp.]|jgi:D-ala D-ala ligase N-terminal domain protein|nr:D-alanine--D-alanine ligase [Clostridium sp.]
MKIKVGVIFGGESAEHEVSIISAIQAINKMNEEKYDIIPIYITKDRQWYTGAMLKDIDSYQDLSLIKKYATNVVLVEKNNRFILQKKKGLFKREVAEIDIAFPIVHGTNVEDGILQGYLQTIGIPFVGPNTYAGVVGQDKVFMKAIFEKEDLPLSKYVWFYDSEYKTDKDEVLKKISKLKYPLIVKPATTGSSIGISYAEDEAKLCEAIDDAINYDTKILVEEVVENLKEVNISVLGNYEHQKLSVIEEVNGHNKFLTYEDKYIGGGKTKAKFGVKSVPSCKGSKGMLSASRKIPADLSDKLKEEVETVARKAFKALGSSGCCRIDFLIDSKKNKVYVNEINSIPGSLAFYLWEPLGKDYTELLDDMINIGIKDYKKRSSKTYTFDTNILQGFANNSLKGGKTKLK